MNPKFKNVILNAGMVIVSTVVALMAAELVLRAKYGAPLAWLDPQVRHVLTDYGYKLEPNQEGTFTCDKPVRSNSQGFRDDEWEIGKRDGDTRIMVIGDSLTFGNCVRVEDTFTAVLKNSLHAKGMNVDVFRAAVGGWSTYDELDFLKAEGLRYNPDLVIVGFYINDYQIRRPFDPKKFAREKRVDARPVWLRWLPYRYIYMAKRSALVYFLRMRMGNEKSGETFRAKILKGQIDFDTNERVQATYTYLREMKEVLAKQGADLMVAYLPPVDLGVFPKTGRRHISHLAAFAEKEGISFVDLSKLFLDSDRGKSLYLYPWDYHPSPEGHRMIANGLLDAVISWRNAQHPTLAPLAP